MEKTLKNPTSFMRIIMLNFSLPFFMVALNTVMYTKDTVGWHMQQLGSRFSTSWALFFKPTKIFKPDLGSLLKPLTITPVENMGPVAVAQAQFRILSSQFWGKEKSDCNLGFSASRVMMNGYGFLFSSRAFLLLQLLPGILAWGKEGHFAVCKIAEGLLHEGASDAVKALLPEYANGDLASLCSWPDEIRFHYRWSGPLHYLNTPDFRCNYQYCRDCHDSVGRKDRCVTGAIYNYTSQLMTYNNPASEYNMTEALLFLSHFIGDVHQPLHAGFTGDEGGNTIIIRWFRRKTNLHHIWDTMIIESALKTFYNSDLGTMIQAIEKNITDNWSTDILSWENCALNQSHHITCPDPYASESVKLACKYAYRNATPGSTLSDEYFLSRLPVVERRLAQAGVRLAATLNRIFKSQPSISEA